MAIEAYHEPKFKLNRKIQTVFVLSLLVTIVAYVTTTESKTSEEQREQPKSESISQIVVSEQPASESMEDGISQEEEWIDYNIPEPEEVEPVDNSENSEEITEVNQVPPKTNPIEEPKPEPAPKVASVPEPVPLPPTPNPEPSPPTLPASNTAPSSSTPTVTTPPAEPSAVDEIISFINVERAKNGLSPVNANSDLNSAAYLKSKDMADNNYFAHTSPAGISDVYFVNQVGYKYRAIGFNIAKGDFGGNQGVVDAWVNSSGHRENILASYGQDIGIGIYGDYYTMMIAEPL